MFCFGVSRIPFSTCGPALNKQLISSQVGWSDEIPFCIKLYTGEGVSFRVCFLFFFFFSEVPSLTDIPNSGLQNVDFLYC